MSLTTSWLNLILRFSSQIHKRKESLMTAGIIKTIFLSIYIIFLELVLFIISLPSYFFMTPKKMKQLPKNEAHVYTLRRKLSLGLFFFVVLLFIIQVLVFFILTFMAGSVTVNSVG